MINTAKGNYLHGKPHIWGGGDYSKITKNIFKEGHLENFKRDFIMTYDKIKYFREIDVSKLNSEVQKIEIGLNKKHYGEKAKEYNSYLSDDFSADYKNITEEKN